MGFITPISIPEFLNEAVNPVTNVFPISVSVPVLRSLDAPPFFIHTSNKSFSIIYGAYIIMTELRDQPQPIWFSKTPF